jgi:hypothetical protein
MTKAAHQPPSDRTRLRRLHEKAAYDRATIDAILDAMPLAHVGYVMNGAPVVTRRCNGARGTGSIGTARRRRGP